MRSRILSSALFLAATSLSLVTSACAPAPAELTDAHELRVESVSVAGREVRFQLAEPLSEAALVTVRAELDADGPDPATDEIVRRTLASPARLEDDGLVLVLTAPEALSPSVSYRASLRFGDASEVALGEIAAPRGGARVATVHVTSITPKDDQGLQPSDLELRTPVERDLDHVTIKFSAPIDCAELKRQGRSALRIYTGTGDDAHPPGRDHDIYHDAEAIAGQSGGYRGHIECSSDEKTVKYFLPGRLYGGTKYRIRLRVPTDTNGHQAQAEDFMFKTQNPGLKVKVNLAMNKMDGHNEECDGALFQTNRRRCDTYISMVGSFVNPRENVADETSGSLGTWDDWNMSDWKDVDLLWLDTPGPIGDDVRLAATAFDSDGNQKAANLLHVSAAIHTAVAAALSAAGNPWAALPGAVGAVQEGIALAIQNNDDDNLGHTVIQLSAHGDNSDGDHVANWWGMRRDPDSASDRDEGDGYWQYGHKAVVHNKFGEIFLFYTVTESPRSWIFVPVLL